MRDNYYGGGEGCGKTLEIKKTQFVKTKIYDLI